MLSKHDMSDPCILHRSYLGNTAIFLVAILVPVTAWLWLLAVLDAVAAPTAGRAARLCPLSGVAVELQIQTRE